MDAVETDTLWGIKGISTCFDGWCRVLGVGPKRARKTLEHVRQKRTDLPEDKRKYNGRAPQCEWFDCDAFFLHVYENMGESLAEADDLKPSDNVDVPKSSPQTELEEKTACPKGQQVSVHASSNLLVTENSLEERWLAKTSWEDMYFMYQSWSKLESKASMKTLCRVYRTVWSKSLRFRKISQHARCAECARLAAMRAKAKTDTEKIEIKKAWEYHLRLTPLFASLGQFLCWLSDQESQCTIIMLVL